MAPDPQQSHENTCHQITAYSFDGIIVRWILSCSDFVLESLQLWVKDLESSEFDS